MQCIQIYDFGAANTLRVSEIEDLHPDKNQVCITVIAIGVNPVDTYIRQGQYNISLSFPHILGFDAAGIIKEVGTHVSRWKPKDRAFVTGSLTGTYAQETLCNPNQIYRLPDNISFEQGAAIGIPYATAYRALFIKAKAKAPMTCLIHGASGGVGTAAIQLAKMAHLKILATAGSPEGLKLIKELGADWMLNHNESDHFNQIREITRNKGVDIILEMLSDVNLSEDLKCIAHHGKIVIIGCRGLATFNPRDAMTRDASLYGMLLKNATPLEQKKIYQALIKGLGSGVLKPVIGKIFPLKDAPKAHEAIVMSKAYGKIILRP